MDRSPEIEMNSSVEQNAGQGSDVPPVPPFEIPCEKCRAEIELADGMIPVTCPHCGYHLRPETNSLLSHFLFVLRYRIFTWRGRCTRKEFWSFILFSHLILFLFILFLHQIFAAQVPECSCSQAYLGVIISTIFFAFIVYVPFIGIPKIFLFARRLHDIGLSGITVIIHMLALALMTCMIVVTHILQEKSISEVYSYEEIVAQSPVHTDIEFRDEIGDELAKPEMSSTVHTLIVLSTFLNFALNGLQLFFFVITFIDSKRGTNKYGPSRKYPLAIS